MESVRDETSLPRSKPRPPSPSKSFREKLRDFRESRRRKERPFILPTAFGLLFGTLATIQLIMAIASQNNLIYLFVFSEISIALASMFFTNSNIQRVRIAEVEANQCFADEQNPIEIRIDEHPQKPSYQLYVRWNFEKERTLVPAASASIQLPWKPMRRGIRKIPSLIIESSFPFGLLRAWKVKNPAKTVLVYPKRDGELNFPSSARGDFSVMDQGLFYDLKPFQKGDWPRRIDWRASQRAQQLLIRRFEEESHNNFYFNWNQTSHLQDFEKQVSQLALWVDRAERSGASFVLQIGNWSSGLSRGHAHWVLCMEKLALLSPEEF